jgi:hypothetical protein
VSVCLQLAVPPIMFLSCPAIIGLAPPPPLHVPSIPPPFRLFLLLALIERRAIARMIHRGDGLEYLMNVGERKNRRIRKNCCVSAVSLSQRIVAVGSIIGRSIQFKLLLYKPTRRCKAKRRTELTGSEISGLFLPATAEPSSHF